MNYYEFHFCGRHFGNNKEVIFSREEFLEDENNIVFIMSLQCLSITEPSALMLKVTILKINEKRSCFSSTVLVGLTGFLNDPFTFIFMELKI